MAHIQKDPRSQQGVWYAAYRRADGSRAFRSTKTRIRREAQVIADAWEAAEREAARGELTRGRVQEILSETLARVGLGDFERISVKSWLKDWLEAKNGTAAASSLKAYSQAVREFLEFLGPQGQRRSLESITERDIERFVRQLVESGRSPVTVNKLVRKYLSAPFEKARKTGKIKYNPVHGTAPLKTETLPKEPFTPEQVSALLRVAQPDWQGAILFAYGTGARLGDVANLKWSDLDVANGVVVFREGKTNSQAVIGLHPDFLDWLSIYPCPGPLTPDAPLFPSLAGKAVKGEHGLSNTFIKLMEQAGIEKRLLRAAEGGRRSG
jgi:integrase